jgi:peroxiredoxin
VKRNYLVIVVVVVAVVLMAWAGVANYRKRKEEQDRLKQMQAMMMTATPQPSAAGANSGSEPEMMTNPLAGKAAPDFTLKDTTGRKVSLSSYKGKAVVLDFWATWCAPCKIEIPWLEKLRDQYASQGLEVLGVSEDDLDLDDKAKLAKEKQDIADSATKLHINYPVLIDDNETSKPYGGIDALPTTFYIDRNGKVVAATIGLADRDEIEANIQKALGGQKAVGSETQAQKGQS